MNKESCRVDYRQPCPEISNIYLEQVLQQMQQMFQQISDTQNELLATQNKILGSINQLLEREYPEGPEYPEHPEFPEFPDISIISEKLDTSIELLQELVRASETELVELKFDTGIRTLAISILNDPGPDNVSATGYTREPVWDILNRTSPELYVVNLGPGTIFLRISRDGKVFSQAESVIFEGEVKTFYDVYEVRLRSPTADTQYIITEFEYFKQKDVTFLSGRPYVSEIAVAVAGVPNTENVVTNAVQGLRRNAHTGYLINDGPGNLLVRLSNDGVTYAPTQTMIPNQILDLDGEDIYSILIDASVNNTAYRLAVH